MNNQLTELENKIIDILRQREQAINIRQIIDELDKETKPSYETIRDTLNELITLGFSDSRNIGKKRKMKVYYANSIKKPRK